MYHNRQHLLKLLRWAQIIAYCYLVISGINLLATIATGITYSNNPAIFTYGISERIDTWFLGGLLGNHFSIFLGSLFFCLLFFGLSFAIRYLLALLVSARRRPHRISNPVRS